MPPPLCSPDQVLDDFIVDTARVYAPAAQEASWSGTDGQLCDWHDYFLRVFQNKAWYCEHILHRDREDAQLIVNVIQELLNSQWVEERFKIILEVVLWRLARTSQLYPKHLVLHNVMHPYVLVTWDATVRTVHGYIEDNVVAIKISGLPPESMAVSQNMLLWAYLRHQNVLPFHGICILRDSGGLGLVSPFLKNGNVVEYLERFPHADRRQFIRGVAAGMCYLHENGVVHGSIHGQNILISDTIPPQACLADYGVASVISNYSNLMHSYHHSMPAGRRLSHFLAPEHESVMDSFSKTEAGDVYAFSTATYQILTGRLPSPRHISMWCRSQAMRPVTRVHRDRGLDKPMQHILVNYWEQSLERRPSAREIVDMLEDMHARMREAQRSMCLGKVASSLGVILNNVEHYKHLLSCTKAQAQSAIDAFQTLLDTENFMGRTHLIAAMRRLSERTELYPSRFALNGPVPAADEVPAASGSYADIYKVNYLGEETCFKVIRVSQRTLVEHMAKVYAREIILWGQLSHPNILPFYGLSRFRTQLSFVSRWATNGNIGEYLARNPDANRILLCSDTAAGVEYLHKNDIVHGDLKGLNVLIDSSGHALLGDFGLASVTDPEILKWTAQATIASKGGTTRWQAPELHETEESVAGNIYNSKESDIFAWASLCYEIFTGRLPFFEAKRESTVLFRILRGDTPSRPQADDPVWFQHGLTEHIWDLMLDCWKFQPSERPNMSVVISRLDVEKPIDARPPAEWDAKDAMRFRNAQDANMSQDLLPFWEEHESLLSRVILGA